MRWIAFATALALTTLTACAETVRCPDGEIFDEDGACVPIPDGGPSDAGPTDDAGA